MSKRLPSLSQETFERLIARAIELDDAGNDRIEFERARAVAQELGISPAAWDAALRERELMAETAAVHDAAVARRRRPLMVALAGTVAGALAGVMAPHLDTGVLALGATAVAAGAALIVDGARRGASRDAQVDLAAWWLSLAAGIMAGMGEVHVDPAVFAGVSWVGCAALGLALRRRRHTALIEPGACRAG
jgi:hypothetical protein